MQPPSNHFKSFFNEIVGVREENPWRWKELSGGGGCGRRRGGGGVEIEKFKVC